LQRSLKAIEVYCVPLVGMMNDFPGPALAQRHYANK